MTVNMDNSKAVADWLSSIKSKKTFTNYRERWEVWLEYCKAKGLLTLADNEKEPQLVDNGDIQLADMKKRRSSDDNSEKFFYDMQVPKFYQWLRTEYKGKKTKEPLADSSALCTTTTVRSFFSYHRYSLQIQKDALPSSEKIENQYPDHAFDIYQLRQMFQCGDLRERTILASGINLALRSGDFLSLDRNTVETAIKREQELADNEKREADVIEFELMTTKEHEPASCHFAKETVELLKVYLTAYPKTTLKTTDTEFLFPLDEDSLSEILKRLAKKANITISGRIRWHCLRKFFITLAHGKVTEPVLKYMVGKHIGKDLRTYIQSNRETFKAFKLIEPLISLTKSNGNGSLKTLEAVQEQGAKLIATLKVIEKVVPKETMERAIIELAEEFGIKLKVETKAPKEGIGMIIVTPMAPSLDEFLPMLTKAIQQKELEQVLEENGNNNA